MNTDNYRALQGLLSDYERFAAQEHREKHAVDHINRSVAALKEALHDAAERHSLDRVIITLGERVAHLENLLQGLVTNRHRNIDELRDEALRIEKRDEASNG